ncbi:MAG: hypothetical protein KDD51_11525 [Bdellovibrionales bacterium]|nr:hypothetical protein [Bdellovibrionales bacterium]
MKNFTILAMAISLTASIQVTAERVHNDAKGAVANALPSPLLSTQNINASFSQTAVDPIIDRNAVPKRGIAATSGGSSFADRIKQMNTAPPQDVAAAPVTVNPPDITPQNSDGNMPDNRQTKTTSAITSRAGNISLQEANGDDWGSKVSFHSSEQGDYICVDRGLDGTQCTEPGTATQNSAGMDQKVWQEYMESTNAEGITMAEFHGCKEAAQTGVCEGGPGVGQVKLMTTGTVPVNMFSGAKSSDPMDPKNLYYGYPNGAVTPNNIAAVFVVNGRARAGGNGMGNADQVAGSL